MAKRPTVENPYTGTTTDQPCGEPGFFTDDPECDTQAAIRSWAKLLQEYRVEADRLSWAFTEFDPSADGYRFVPGVDARGWATFGEPMIDWAMAQPTFRLSGFVVGSPAMQGWGSVPAAGLGGMITEFGILNPALTVKQQAAEVVNGRVLIDAARSYLERATKSAGIKDAVPPKGGNISTAETLGAETAAEVAEEKRKIAAEWSISDYTKLAAIGGLAWLFWKDR